VEARGKRLEFRNWRFEIRDLRKKSEFSSLRFEIGI
jgi:hypothetical protein